ncbi:MAG TPA: LPS export ABC transporter periplasmic protein LptC [Dongiaceae bacterium]|jgi:lipopolysaccharide export system protein LptC|nr:LPS export ABC transporter periplasmic protein LptC [Dongiaceae bacterium]
MAGPRKRRGAVFWLKIAFPVLAATVTTVIIVWSRLVLHEIRVDVPRSHDPARITGPRPGASVRNVVYAGVDARGRPYTINVRRATADPGKPGNYFLEQPDGELTLPPGRWAALRADKGYYDGSNRIIDLADHVSVFRSDGMLFETDKARIDIAANVVTSDSPVIGSGDHFSVTAQGVRIFEDGNRILFLGKAHLLLYHSPDSPKPGQEGTNP